MPGAHQSHSITPPPQLNRGEKCDERLMGQDKDRERSLADNRHRQNRLNLGEKKKFNLSPIKSESDNQKINPNIKNTFTPTPPFFLGLTLLPSSLSPPSSGAGGWGMGVAVSSSHVVCAAPSSSDFHCSSVRSLSRETILHKLLQHESFPRAAALHELPQRGSLPTGCSPSGTSCSSMSPPRRHKPCQQTCSGMGSSLHGSTGPGRSLLQPGLPMGSQGVLQASTCCGVGSLPRTAGGSLLHRGPPWAAGEQLVSPWSSS